MSKNNERNYNYTFRADNLTQGEAYKLEEACIKNKRELASDARGTSIVSKKGALKGKQENKSLESGND